MSAPESNIFNASSYDTPVLDNLPQTPDKIESNDVEEQEVQPRQVRPARAPLHLFAPRVGVQGAQGGARE